MPKPRLFLHVGPPKTGTSALQARLRDGGVAGLLYPKTGQWADGAHHLLAFALLGQRQRGAVEIPPLADLMRDLEAEIAAHPGDVLLSSEALMPDQGFAELMRQLSPRCLARFRSVTTVLVLRDPLARAASLYNQAVKDPVMEQTLAPDDYLARHGREALLMPLLTGWRKASPDLLVLPYGPSESLVTRFGSAIGHPMPPAPGQSRPNRSMGGAALLALLLAKRLLPDHRERTAFFDRLREDKAFHIWRGESFPFSAEAVEAFLGKDLEPDRAAVRRQLGWRLPLEKEPVPARFILSASERSALQPHLERLPGFAAKAGEIGQFLDGFMA